MIPERLGWARFDLRRAEMRPFVVSCEPNSIRDPLASLCLHAFDARGTRQQVTSTRSTPRQSYLEIGNEALFVPRPGLSFRVGVSGARKIEDGVLPLIKKQLNGILTTIRREFQDACVSPAARAVYAIAKNGDVDGRLSLVSPLADGADRLAAEVAVALDFELEIALPFRRQDYADDFTAESREDFDRWLDDGWPCIALDGCRGDVLDRSYEAAGRHVVRNCDLLIAIWDGRSAKGRGGTGDIVRFSIKSGRPVWWIDVATMKPPRLIVSPGDLESPDGAAAGDAAESRLVERLRLALLPPAYPSRKVPHGPLSALVQRLDRGSDPSADPLRAYLDERPQTIRWIWQFHDRLQHWLARIARSAGEKRREVPSFDGDDHWIRHYLPADAVSIACRDRYRSSYAWVFVLATLAALCAIIALVFPAGKAIATALELAALGGILCLFTANHRMNWHYRWICSRLLAELCRKQEALAILGWSLPRPDLGHAREKGSAEAWVGWYFSAVLRAAPPLQGQFDRERLDRAREFILDKLVVGHNPITDVALASVPPLPNAFRIGARRRLSPLLSSSPLN